MFGIEKVFGRKLGEQTEKKSVGGFGSSKNKKEAIIFFEQPVEAGQKWQTEDGNFAVTIVKHLEKTGRFEIVLKDKEKEISEVLKKSSEELTALLLSGGYELIPSKTETTSAPAVFEAVPETSATAAQPRSETPSLLDEYVFLDEEMREITEEKVGALGTDIGEILEENADILEGKYDEFIESRDTIVESINRLIDEDNPLYDAVEKADPNIPPELLAAKKVNYDKLLALYTELQSLETLVNIYLAEEKNRSEAQSVPPIVPAGEKIDPLPEPAIPVSSNTVVNMGDYRRKTPSQPAEKPIDSPFMKKSAKNPETQNTKLREGITHAEEKIGKEKYVALAQFVESSWGGFQAELKGKKIPKKVWSKIWEEQALPHLKGRIAAFLREQTELEPGEYEAVYDSLIRKVSEKK